jgi:alkylhydroperoxidase family enzyme
MLDPRAVAAIEKLRLMHQYPPQERINPFYTTMARSPQVFASFLQLGGDLSADSALDPVLRELAVLRTGWLCGAPYQWGEHVRVAGKLGIDAATIERVREGPDAPGWSAIEAAVLRAVDELHGGAAIADATWAVLAAHFDDRQLVELPLLVGHYHMTAFVQNALRITLNPGSGGLSG